MKKSIVVIGGGISGLTVAYKLQQKNYNITVLEANSEVGGSMQTIQENGFMAEKGPNTIMETSSILTDFIQEIGLSKEKIYPNEIAKNRFIVRNNQLLALPTSPPAFLKSKLFTAKAKLRLLKEPFIKKWNNSYEENLAQFVQRRLGQEFLDYAINPFVAGIFAGEPEHISVIHGFNKLYQLEQKYGSLIKGQIKGVKERKKRNEVNKQKARMFSFKNGLQSFPLKLEELLNQTKKNTVIKNAKVISINKNNNKWDVQYTLNNLSQKIKISADKIIYSAPIYKLNNILLNNKNPIELNEFLEINHPPISSLTLGFAKKQISHSLNGFGMLIPKIENFSILGALSLFENRSPKDYVTLTLFIGGVRNPQLAELSKKELVQLALKDLEILLGIKNQPTFIYHKYWHNSIPQYDVGYAKYKNLMTQIQTNNSNLYFAGNYVNGISAADTILNSIQLAKDL